MPCVALPWKLPAGTRAHWVAQLCCLHARITDLGFRDGGPTQCTRLPSALAATRASASALTLSAYCAAVHVRLPAS